MENCVKQILSDYRKLFGSDMGHCGALLEQLSCEPGDLADRMNMKGHVTGSALVFDNGLKSVILIHHKGLNRWLQPGGHVESGEAPVDGARRELEEETGLQKVKLADWHATTGIPIDIDSHLIPANPSKGEGAHYHHDFMYVFQVTGSDKVALQREEVAGYNWVPIAKLKEASHGDRLVRAAAKLDVVLGDFPVASG